MINNMADEDDDEEAQDLAGNDKDQDVTVL